MREEPGKEKDANNKDPVEEEDGKESEELQLPKISTYVTAVPTAVQKLKRLTAAKKPVITESPPKLLEGPFGLGSLVSPAFQRFNNIDFFTFLYFVVVTGHGIAAIIFGLIFFKYEIIKPVEKSEVLGPYPGPVQIFCVLLLSL
ncbi:solute carrier organic anion transporter family member 6A1-like protein [Cricetulus griseus]|uniref:Solute carrier organic anion transporter family member 6A1-like protein n=1 Tax=Cricetulus griseus TaxID=10029 RepID=A0A061IDR0_CRIGR|nr:solute carrier organic anion transporter family member 6A1-like protein [Cricetulus griseus]